MATLTIDDLTLNVVGTPSWSKNGQHRGMPSQGFIEAQVRVPASVLTTELDRTNAHILLTLDSGGRVEGYGMWRVGSLVSNGYVASVRFEGVGVTEQF